MPVAKVMISLPEPFLEEVDRYAQEERMSRSELIREAMKLYIRIHRRVRPGEDPEVRAATRLQDELALRSPGSVEDSTEELRRWRRKRG